MNAQLTAMMQLLWLAVWPVMHWFGWSMGDW